MVFKDTYGILELASAKNLESALQNFNILEINKEQLLPGNNLDIIFYKETDPLDFLSQRLWEITFEF